MLLNQKIAALLSTTFLLGAVALTSIPVYAGDTPGTRLDCRNAKGNKVAANKNCNDAPLITTTALPNATEGQAYSATLGYTDTHNDPVTWRIVEGQEGMTISAQGVIQWQPGSDSAPGYTVTVLVADDMLGSQVTFTLMVNQADTENRAPVISSEPQAYLTENTPWSYSIIATDADGDNITYTLEAVQPQPPQGLTLSGNTLSWTPAFNQAGDHPVKVMVSDGNTVVEQSFILEVANRNRAPQFISIPVTSGTENTPYTTIVEATDADNDTLTYTLVSGPQGMSLVGNTLNWLPGYDQSGSHAVSLEVTDGETPVPQTYTLIISNTNRAPEVTSAPVTSVAEGQEYTYTVEATDADGDVLNYTLTQAPQGMTLTDTTLTWQPGYVAAGTVTVKVTISDGEVDTPHEFEIAVANTNLPPVFTSTPVTAGAEGQAYSYTLNATDADGQALTFELVTAPTGMTLQGATLGWTPDFNQAGSPEVVVSVSDTETTVNQSFTVVIENTNREPVFTSTPDTSVAEGQAYRYAFAASDADGDLVSYASHTLPTGMTLEGNELVWTPGYEDAGSYPITLSASDDEATTEQAFTLVVSNTNRAPQFTSTPVLATAEGADYAYALAATDADGQALTFALETGPAGMALVNNTLVWQAGYEQAGSYPVTVTVSDNEATIAQSFTLVVANTNRAPEFISTPVTQVDENTPYLYTLQAIDPDGQFLSYSVTAAPAGMVLMLDTLQWLPDYQQAGEYTITVTATDGEATVEQTFTLTAANVNRIPVITSQPPAGPIYEMALYNYTPTATDDDGESLTWQLSGEPSGIVLMGSTVRWQPLNGQTGDYSYTLTVTDGKASASQTVSVTVVMLDSDNDTVRDSDDSCADTPGGETINAEGCALVQLDSDNDTVNDKLDQCADSHSFETIGADGCSDEKRDTDGDGIADIEDPSPNDATNQALPKVTIETPANLTTLGVSPVEVSGTVDPAAASLTLNGALVSFDSSGHYATQVTLAEGHNTIIARMVSSNGIVSTASVSVSLDKTAPYITIESHTDGQVVNTPSITLTGLINDIVRGTVEEEQAYVTVNGIHATISNRSYAAYNIPLQPGANTLVVLAADQAGNIAEKELTVIYQAPVGLQKVEIIGGQNQTGIIGTALANPLSVKVLDAAGQPVANKPVVFRVTQGDGLLATDTDSPANGILLQTNGEGIASTPFKLGLRSGVANNKVTVRVVGYDENTFIASATPATADKVSVNSGNNQYGEKYQPLPAPFVVAVTDNGANVVAGAEVEFTVVKGGGHFQNGEKTMIATTDTDGRASAHLTNGGLSGFDAQVVQAKLLGTPAEQTISAGFTATAMQAGDPGNTSVSGIVTDTEDTPLIGATVRVDGTTRQAVTDDKGKFIITEAPVGPVHLIVDGSTIEGDAEYPTLSYNIVTVSGVDNPLTAPVYMVKLNTANKQYAGLQDVAVTLPEVPGFKLEIPAGSVTFPDGSKEGYVSVTVVNSSKVPMAPPNGMQPQFIVTIQPTGAMFEPPARLTLPNVDGHAPGRQVEMFSYDHDLEEFVAIGLGTVSKDGKTIQSNPGVGVVKAGWHCGAQPGGSGCCESDEWFCGECGVVTPFCATGCKPEPNDVVKKTQIAGNCKTETCGGGKFDTPTDDATTEQKADCRECKDGELKDSCELVASVEKGTADGATMCCRGELEPYAFNSNDSTYTDTAKAIAKLCTYKHEEIHASANSGWECLNDSCGVWPTQKSNDGCYVAAEECFARQRTVQCLVDYKDICGADTTCQSNIESRLINRYEYNPNTGIASCDSLYNDPYYGFECKL